MQHEDNETSNGVEVSEDLTIPKLFYEKTTSYGKDRVAMREKEFGIWRPITWQGYFDNVKYMGTHEYSIVLENISKL